MLVRAEGDGDRHPGVRAVVGGGVLGQGYAGRPAVSGRPGGLLGGNHVGGLKTRQARPRFAHSRRAGGAVIAGDRALLPGRGVGQQVALVGELVEREVRLGLRDRAADETGRGQREQERELGHVDAPTGTQQDIADLVALVGGVRQAGEQEAQVGLGGERAVERRHADHAGRRP